MLGVGDTKCGIYKPKLGIYTPRVMGRVERGSFTLTLSQNRAWKSPLTRLFTLNSLCIDITLGSDLSATLTTATFPTAAACRGFDASACTPTPRDLLSSHWQLRLHLIWKVANPLYRCAPRGTRTGSSTLKSEPMYLSPWPHDFSFECSRVVRPASRLRESLMHEGQPQGIRRRVTASWRACHLMVKWH